MDEERKEGSVTFAVDLTKEEYLRFYKAITRYSSAQTMQTIGLCVVIAMVVIPFYSLYSQSGLQALLSLDAVSLLIPAALLLIYNFAVMPWMRKRQALRGYDAAVAGGQVFAGTVTVNRQGVIKTTPSGSLTMSFSDRILFLEQEDMQIFVNTQGRGIVLPARCMTPETANAVRDIALSVLPSGFCRIKAPIQCTRETPMELEETAPEQALFEAEITYNAEDKTYISKEIFFRHMKNGVLPCCIVSLVAAFLFGFDTDKLTVLLIFGVTVVIAMLLLLFNARRRAKAVLSDDNFRFAFKITEKAVILNGGESRGIFNILWSEVKHVYESQKYVEFYTKYHYACIPKRLIADMDSFGKLVENCRKERV